MRNTTIRIPVETKVQLIELTKQSLRSFNNEAAYWINKGYEQSLKKKKQSKPKAKHDQPTYKELVKEVYEFYLTNFSSLPGFVKKLNYITKQQKVHLVNRYDELKVNFSHEESVQKLKDAISGWLKNDYRKSQNRHDLSGCIVTAEALKSNLKVMYKTERGDAPVW